jgi:hypothetical protein
LVKYSYEYKLEKEKTITAPRFETSEPYYERAI